MALDEYQRTVGRPDDFRRINNSRKQLQARLVDRNCVEREYYEESLKLKKRLADLNKTAAIYNKSYFCDKPILSEESERHEYVLHVEILPQHIATIRVYINQNVQCVTTLVFIPRINLNMKNYRNIIYVNMKKPLRILIKLYY